MPLVDLPLAELYRYSGRNPCPHDIDSYWDSSLAEMNALDPEVTLAPAQFKSPAADCFDLTFTGTGGARIYAKYLRPKGIKKPSPAILQFHGYSGNSGDWLDKQAYVAAGFCVASMDVRGQGGRSEDTGGIQGNTLRGHIIRGLSDPDPKKLLFRDIFLDTALLAKVVSSFDEVDENRIAAMGGSQGGALTIACAALAADTVKIAVPVFPFLCDYQRVWEMDLAENAYEELKSYFRSFDPMHKREQEIFAKLGYIDLQHMAKRIKSRVLMGCGLMDRICPPSTQFAAYNRISSQKEVAIYPDFGHEGLPGFADRAFEFLCELL